MKKYIGYLVLVSLLLTGCTISNQSEYDDELKIYSRDEESIVSGEKSGDASENLPSGEESKVSGETEKIEDKEIEKEIETEVIPTDTSTLSNKTNAWGFRRMKNNVRPEFTSSYTKILDTYEGIYCGNSDEKVIYLTFDEGYENGYTSTILDTLKEKNVTAVFFVTMPYVKQNKELVQRMIDEGHIVGNHTVNHPSMPDVTDDEKLKKEVMDLHDYVKENFNYEMEFLRPPKGEYSERTVAISKELGYRTVLWSSAYDDWDTSKQDRLEYARGMILNYVHNGCVMLLHAVSKDNTALLGEVIDEIRNQGYEIKPLTDFEY